METVLRWLNSGVPGVVGSLVTDSDGKILAEAFPPMFDLALVGKAASLLTESTVGLELMTGPVSMIDLRFGDSRVVAKPVAGAMLLIICVRAINLQLLAISASVATNKLAKMVQNATAMQNTGSALRKAQPEQTAPVPATAPAAAVRVAQAPAEGVGDVLPSSNICP